MKIIDAHTHAFPDPLAARAMASLQEHCPWQAVGNGTVGALLASMDVAGVDVALLCTIATKPDQPAGILAWCRKTASPRLVPLPSVHPATPDVAGWMRRIADEGFVAIKLHPQYQDIEADDPRMDAIYAAAEETRLVVQSHCGRDIAFPPDDDRAAPRRFAAVLRRHPGLRLVCTHLGGWRMWDEVQQHLLGSATYLETSFSLEELGPQRALEMIRHHGTGRVMFGTDWPWQDQQTAVRQVSELDLTPAERDAILSTNARTLFGLRT
jgi:hypothetical protein